MLNARVRSVLMASAAALVVTACGADDIASPGEGVIIVPAPAPAPAPTPTPTPTPTPPALATPAAACPSSVFTDRGTISGPTGTYRNCEFPSRFTANTQVARAPGVIYSMGGRVDVGTDQGPTSTGTNVILTIDPGVVVFASGAAFLAVNRGNQIDAVGTATQPIIFTGRQNITGAATDATSQLWGGIVLLGRAPITDCLASGATPGTAACERDTEGTSNALYGGASPADSSGRMRYVQIRYSGFVLERNSELQGLTPSGTGSGTELQYIQVHNSSDDGIEVFGGRGNAKHLVITGAEDDSFDTDVGYKGFVQYMIAIQRSDIGDSMLEIDSDNANDGQTPRQNVRLSNFTFIKNGDNRAGNNGTAILLRGGADYSFFNGVMVSPQLPCLAVSRAQTASTTANAAIDEAGAPVFRSVQFQCPSGNAFSGRNGVTNEQVAALFNAGTNVSSTFSPTLSAIYINGSAETAITAFDASTINPFFDRTTYIGAVRDANDRWFAGWTCNSNFANFGATSGSCTSIPVI
ncbi:hypothetical protein [Blastomonas aquatica]|uniref:Secreted protein n=1 Tax=Blastomonas aquatica TaxID=1510276 RepID=A0ABQ1J3A9_9SPHN|nr:hypothetical protein [Blastomonas aquatica]GGB57627.1 hypothetical protein GCM10010833_10480 [Blastomonas aquatica]